MNNSPYLSVIIPTYNVEKFIEKTLYSIIEQSFRDYEIIIVDDASTDNTYQLCLNFKANNPSRNIEVFQLKHGGVSMARNFGISKASGKYIHFLDSDDEILHDMYNSFYDLSQHFNYDLIIGAVNIIKPTCTVVQTIQNDIDCQIKAKIVKWLREISVADKDWMLNVVWNKWFKRDIILFNHLHYKQICPGEDYEFVMQYLRYCESVFVSSKPIYKYYQRDSISLLSRKYSHKSQIDRRLINWETTQGTLALIGVFNPIFLFAEGYSLYCAICGDMYSDGSKNRMLKDYFRLNQYNCVSLYFKSRNTFANKIISSIFATRNTLFIRIFFVIKSLIKKLIAK